MRQTRQSEVNISFVMSLYLSVRLSAWNISATTGTDFHKI